MSIYLVVKKCNHEDGESMNVSGLMDQATGLQTAFRERGDNVESEVW